ncbi:MAG: hypothetical protein J2P19_15080, partial [Pseudonocardia sp.]|nr:hypothetical protein [Pseudonocardia sp.]
LRSGGLSQPGHHYPHPVARNILDQMHTLRHEGVTAFRFVDDLFLDLIDYPAHGIRGYRCDSTFSAHGWQDLHTRAPV